MKPIPIRVVFFDLGDTLVRKVAVSPAGVQFAWIPGARELIARLRAAGARIGLISNTADLTRTRLLQLLPSDFSFDLFDEKLVLLSSETDIAKPDPRVFRLAVQRALNLSDLSFKLRIDPPECLFVGEDLKETLTVQQVGMIGVRVNVGPQPDIGELDNVLRERGFLE